MRRFLPGSVFVIAALNLLPAGGVGQVSTPPTTQELFRQIAQITDVEWAAIARGQAVAKVLETDNREVAVAGAVRIAASSDLLAGRYRDIENLKRSTIVLDVGRFSTPPRPDDLLSVPFEDYNLDLRDCKPGDCRVRLGAPEIDRFHREVDWRSGDWRERSRIVWREVLAGYAAAFSREGRRALPNFVNKPEPLSVPAELSLLVERFGFVGTYAPAFFAYLREFGSGPEGLEKVLYWSKDDFGVRPVLRLSEQTIYRTSGATRAVFVATNQIYADHYLDAGLTVTMAIDATEAGGRPAFDMISVSRARTRSLHGVLRTFVRGSVQNRSRDALRKVLASAKASLEQTP
jgi:hypothetical protein